MRRGIRTAPQWMPRLMQRTSARQRGYDTRWDKARKTYLAANPLCVYCREQGQVTQATVVDHIKPHKGDQSLFWDVSNWRALCAPHHNSVKQSEERTGKAVLVTGLDGWPIA